MSNRLFGPSGAPGSAGSLAINTAGAASPVLPATQVVTVNTETVILNPANTTVPLLASLPAGANYDGIPLKFRASGKVHTAGSYTVTLKLYEGTSLTVGSDTLLKTSGAITAFTGDSNWWIEAAFEYDSVSGLMNGTIQFMVNNTLVATAAFTNVPSGKTQNPSGGAASINFLLSVTFGTANAANKIVVVEHAIYDN